MQPLLDAVKQIKQTIQTYKSELMNNESLTRYALVDVLLNALGWDVHDPGKVFPEYNKVVGGRADYALLNSENKPVAILEAKKLSNLNTNDLIQVTNYAFHSGIKYALATDGDRWIVTDAFKQVPFSEKEIMSFSVKNEPENLLLAKLVSLMPTNLSEPDKAFFPVIHLSGMSSPTPSTISNSSYSAAATPVPKLPLSPKLSPSVTIQPANEVPSAHIITNWTPLSKVIKASKRPTALKFPNGATASIVNYSNILKEVAEWLINTQKLPIPPIEDFAQKKRYLINTTAIHKGGALFTGNAKLSNGWFLETNYSSENSIKNALWLLQKAGENPDHYYFQ